MSIVSLWRNVSSFVILTMLPQLCIGSTVCRQEKVVSNRPAQSKVELVAQLGHSLGINSLAFSPNGRLVLTGGMDGTAHLWETDTGRELRRFLGHVDEIRAVAFSPDGL